MNYYGILISVGILTALLVAENLAVSKKYDVNQLWRSSLWVIIGGVVGARIYHVFDYWSYYSQDPLNILFVYKGGLGIFGALVGGIFSMWVYFKIIRQPMLKWLDLAAIVMPLGQAIGRLGNFFNHELYGLPTRLPWGLYVPLEYRPDTFRYNDTFHPLFIYESILNVLLFFMLLLLYKGNNMFGIRRFLSFTSGSKSRTATLPEGVFIATYLVGYGLIRFSLEFLRVETWKINGINVAQMLSLIIIIFSLAIYIGSNKRKI